MTVTAPILVETSLHPLPDGELELLGAVSSVTGAMTRVETGGGALLVDCGMAQGREAARWRFPEGARRVDAVLLTHGHMDHVGSLPALIDGGYDGPILATRATLEIAEVVLRDSFRLGGMSDRDASRVRRRFRELARSVRYDTPTTVEGLDGTVTFREAGHILGSASIDVQTPRTRVVCSGDLGRPDSPILRDFCTTWGERPVDLVVMESTYGDRDHGATHVEVEAELERIVRRAAATGGHILVPAFAIGRTQTVLYHLNTLVEAGRVPRIPVAVDTPMGLRITETYADHQRLFDAEALEKIARGDDPLDFEGLYAVQRRHDSERLREVPGPMLVIAGSGMCTGGRIVGHLQDLLPLPQTTVLFTGFQAPGTPGRAIQQAARQRGKTGGRRLPIGGTASAHRATLGTAGSGRRAALGAAGSGRRAALGAAGSGRRAALGAAARGNTVRLAGQAVSFRAHVEMLAGLSAHADRRELARWLAAIPHPRRIALHHGEPSAQRALREYLE